MSASATNLQVNAEGKLRHFLSTEGLSKTLLVEIMDVAESFMSVAHRETKKVPLLRGKTIANLFFESSTRTRTTFELAAKRLSADVININISTSAAKKGETLLDTLQNLQAMQVDMFVVRHEASGAAHFMASNVPDHVAVINAGDGNHAHPTQAMLDLYTIRKHKPDFSKLTVAIVGDILHSRVARSHMHALQTLGVNEIRMIAPKTLIPVGLESFGIRVFHQMEPGIENADVVMMLRLQRERMASALLPSAHEYSQFYGLTESVLRAAKADAIVMHPGPINRGVEIDSSVADGSSSVILQQVTHGIAIRMAVMSMAMRTHDGKYDGA